MRRLLHVAMTRARERLVLAYPERAETRREPSQPSPFAEEARAALGGEWEEREEELFGPAETLHATFRMLRDELLDDGLGASAGGWASCASTPTSTSPTRSCATSSCSSSRALIAAARPGQTVAEALPRRSTRAWARAVTRRAARDLRRRRALDDYLLDAERDERRRAAALAARDEPSLEAFLPRRGDGLVLSASDIETYRTCPLKYKFARVFRIPQEPTINQRFGILVHQVLERFHARRATDPTRRWPSCSACSTRAGAAAASATPTRSASCARKATTALTRYHERFQAEPAEPVWFERAFAFRLGAAPPARARGPRRPAARRRLRADRLQDRAAQDRRRSSRRTCSSRSTPSGAREAWQLEAAQQAYYYVLDDAEGRRWRATTRRPRVDHRHRRSRSPRGSSPRASSRRRRYAACSIVRLPDRLSGGRAVSGCGPAGSRPRGS